MGNTLRFVGSHFNKQFDKQQLYSMKRNKIQVLSAAALVFVYNQMAYADCYQSVQINSVAPASCVCASQTVGGLTFPSCNSYQVTPFAGYTTCQIFTPTPSPYGSMGFASLGVVPPGTPVDYYSYAVCDQSTSWSGITACVLAIIASGADGAAILAECFSPAGLFTPVAGCYAALAAAGLTTPNLILKCTTCAMTSCTVDPTTRQDDWETSYACASLDNGACIY